MDVGRAGQLAFAFLLLRETDCLSLGEEGIFFFNTENSLRILLLLTIRSF